MSVVRQRGKAEGGRAAGRLMVFPFSAGFRPLPAVAELSS
jgi:hypothetical protein